VIDLNLAGAIYYDGEGSPAITPGGVAAGSQDYVEAMQKASKRGSGTFLGSMLQQGVVRKPDTSLASARQPAEPQVIIDPDFLQSVRNLLRSACVNGTVQSISLEGVSFFCFLSCFTFG
jgi:hypothetical protein